MIEQAFAPAAAAVATGRIPGATLGMVAADGRRWVTHAGMAALVPEPEPLTLDHWFDLASVSKVIATTTMILTLADQGRLDLDAFVSEEIGLGDVEAAFEKMHRGDVLRSVVAL